MLYDHGVTSTKLKPVIKKLVLQAHKQPCTEV